MKHIDIIQNYSDVTEMIADGQLAPNFLVKSLNDQKVYFSNAKGYKLVMSGGGTYNMYQISNGALGYELEVDVTAGADLSFQVLGPDNLPITTNLDYDCQVYSSNADCDTSVYAYQGNETGVSSYELYWSAMETFGQASYQIILFIATDSSVESYVQVTGTYRMTDEESCSCAGGTWDPVNQECVMPTCEEQYEEGTQELCECQGKYWYNDTCNDEPEPEDPCEGYETQEECECVQQGGEWDGSTCIGPDPCDEYEEGTQEKCECEGKYWYNDTCNDEPDPCGDASPEECECIQQGGTWDGSHGSSEGTCNMPSEDPCADAEDPNACECEQQGGTWDGSTCNMPSDE